MTSGVQAVDDYIAGFPQDVQKKLSEIRALVRELAPEAEEKISYQMPTFYLNGNLVHFAAYKNHIGLYPAPSGVAEFEADLAGYKYAKGSIRFPLDQSLPMELIARIVKFRIGENLARKKK